jgi:two-component system response regulator HydG
VNVRILTATNDELSESVRKGAFREDLYHRLNEFKLLVPPLRKRQDDLMEFVEHFRLAANREINRTTRGFHPDVIHLFKNYDWPGNLRELKNTIKRAVLLSTSDLITIDTLPKEMVESVRNATVKAQASAPVYDLKALQETQEREMIMKTLEEVKYNKSKAARILNIDRKTLYLKMERYGID